MSHAQLNLVDLCASIDFGVVSLFVSF